ncbi:MAG: hypothetical protein H4O13_18885 [Xanthomonadales bacterium]|nr:hypothetical protein [Xanthomonadales bacterium]
MTHRNCEQQRVHDQAWRQALKSRFPKIFPARCEIAVSEGWLPLLTELCEQLQGLADAGEGQPEAVEVKQKFGELRLYCRLVGGPSKEIATRVREHAGGVTIDVGQDSAFDKIIDEARRRSLRTCETCGDAGQLCEVREVVTVRCTRHAQR